MSPPGRARQRDVSEMSAAPGLVHPWTAPSSPSSSYSSCSRSPRAPKPGRSTGAARLRHGSDDVTREHHADGDTHRSRWSLDDRRHRRRRVLDGPQPDHELPTLQRRPRHHAPVAGGYRVPPSPPTTAATTTTSSTAPPGTTRPIPTARSRTPPTTALVTDHAYVNDHRHAARPRGGASPPSRREPERHLDAHDQRRPGADGGTVAELAARRPGGAAGPVPTDAPVRLRRHGDPDRPGRGHLDDRGRGAGTHLDDLDLTTHHPHVQRRPRHHPQSPRAR